MWVNIFQILNILSTALNKTLILTITGQGRSHSKCKLFVLVEKNAKKRLDRSKKVATEHLIYIF